MKITTILMLPFIISQVLSDHIIYDNTSHEKLITTAPYLHICYDGFYRVDKLIPNMIYNLYKEKDSIDFVENDKLCSMEIAKIDNPKFKYEISMSQTPAKLCKKEQGFDIFCDPDSNCTRALFCGKIVTNKTINTFDIISINLNHKKSTYNSTIKKWIYDNGKQKCTFSDKTKCVKIKNESAGNSLLVSNTMLLPILLSCYWLLRS